MARTMIDTLKKDGNRRLLKQIAFRRLKHKQQNDHQVWAEGNYPKQLINDAMVAQKLAYIHFNPVKRGYVDRPEHWRYSSARNYLGMDGIILSLCLQGKWSLPFRTRGSGRRSQPAVGNE